MGKQQLHALHKSLHYIYNVMDTLDSYKLHKLYTEHMNSGLYICTSYIYSLFRLYSLIVINFLVYI